MIESLKCTIAERTRRVANMAGMCAWQSNRELSLQAFSVDHVDEVDTLFTYYRKSLWDQI